MSTEVVAGQVWEHHSKRLYRILHIANSSSYSDDYPVMVVYMNTSNGTIWARKLSDWHRSFVPAANT